MTQIPSLEKQVANVYTRAIFKRVIAELKKQAAILQADIIHEGHSKIYQLTEWSNPSRRWIVTYNHVGDHVPRGVPRVYHKYTIY